MEWNGIEWNRMEWSTVSCNEQWISDQNFDR